MSVETKRIFHISEPVENLLNTQLMVEEDPDPDLGFRMWIGRDNVGIGPQTGNLTKWLAKDQNARVVELEATSRLLINDAGNGVDFTSSLATITPTGDIRLYAGDELKLADQYTNGAGSNWGWDHMPFSLSVSEWLIARALLGNAEGSLLNLIASAAGYGGQTWDEVYDSGGAGGGRSSTPDNGAWAATVPVGASNSAMVLAILDSTNTSEVLGILNDAALSTGYAMYLQGDAGGDGSDYDTFGHRIWTEGSVTIGHGTGTGDGVRRSYTEYNYNNDAAVDWASAQMRAEADTAYAQHASVLCKAGNYGAVSAQINLDTTGYINLDSILATSVTAGGSLNLEGATIGMDGKITIDDNVGWDEATAGWSSGTITVNFNTGPDMQIVGIDADATALSITPPSASAAKGLVLTITNTSGVARTIGNWSSGVNWFNGGVNLDNDTIELDAAGGTAILCFIYRGSQLYGSVTDYDGPGV